MISESELAVLNMLADGYRIKQIALQLHMSEDTVKDRMRSAELKLNARNRTHAVANAVRAGIV